MLKKERINIKKLEEIMKCTNIPIYDETEINDINWLKNFKTMLRINKMIFNYLII